MNRTATLISALAIVGLSACTAQQRHMAETALADEPAAAVPAVHASADCSTINFTVTGYPAGTNVEIGEGSQPPYGFTVGSDPFPWFTSVDGGGTGTINVGNYEQAHGFGWWVDVFAVDGTHTRVAGGDVACPE